MDNGLLGALIGGAITCIAAYLTLRHDARLARDQLLQSRFAPAYLALQLYISKWADHAQWNLDILKVASLPEPQLPQMSAVEVAQVSLFASDDAVKVANDFGKDVLAYRLAIGNLVQVRHTQSMSGPAVPELKPAVDALHTTARTLVGSAVNVHLTLRRELRGEK
jgi:hypothetical protein